MPMAWGRWAGPELVYFRAYMSTLSDFPIRQANKLYGQTKKNLGGGEAHAAVGKVIPIMA